MNEKYYTREELTGREPKAVMTVLGIVGLLGIAVGTMLPMIGVFTSPGAVAWWKYVYAGGAACFLVSKFFTPYTGSHPRIKRLMRIESWSAIFFCVAAFFIFYNGAVTRDAWAFTLAGGALLIFTSLSIPRTVNKELRRSEEAKNKKK